MQVGRREVNAVGNQESTAEKVVKNIAIAIAALTFLGMLYAGVKSGFFAGCITYAIANPTVAFAFLAITAVAIGGVIHFAIKNQRPNGGEGADGVRRRSLGAGDANAITSKINGFSIEEKKTYLENLILNLIQDGVDEMTIEHQISIYVTLLDVNQNALGAKNTAFISEYAQAYNALKVMATELHKKTGSPHLSELQEQIIGYGAAHFELQQQIARMGKSNYRDLYIETRVIDLPTKEGMLRSYSNTSLRFDNKAYKELPVKHKEQLLIAFGEVNLDEFKRATFDKVAFAQNYRKALDDAWQSLLAENTDDTHETTLKGFHQMALHNATILMQIAKGTI